MGQRRTIRLLVVGLVAAARSAGALPNPAAVYAERLGYLYQVRQTPAGQKGVVVVAPGVEFDAWDFYRGKVGAAYSYGARFGYRTICERRQVGDHFEEYAVCVKRERAADGTVREERVPLRELMKRHGEPLPDVPEEKDLGAAAAQAALGEVEEDLAETRSAEARTQGLPSSFCWTNYNGHRYIGPIRDQGSCGSCYAFGACATAEGVYNFANGLYDGSCADFSESFIAWCLGRIEPYSSHFFGCDGADYDYYELAALTNEGVCWEQDFPYTESDPGECAHWGDPRVVFSSWRRVDCNDIEAIKTAIMTYGVVDAAVYATTSFESYTGGIWGNTTTNCTATPCYYASANHGVALVGWNDADGGYWILRNSWGTDWGEQGYMRIRYKAAHVACEVAHLTYALPPPAVTTQPAVAITSNAATLCGTVTPHGQATTYWFQYGTNAAYGWSTPPADAGSGSAPVAVSNRVTALVESTLYHFRLLASNASGCAEGDDETFVTLGPAAPPLVFTDAATDLTTTSARVAGRVCPRGAETVFWFEYGVTTNTEWATTPESVGTGWTFVAVSQSLQGLSPGATYHFRLAASNHHGVARGDLLKFDTLPLTAVLLTEGFENAGSIPPGWTQVTLTGSVSWVFVDGDGARTYDKPAHAHQDAYNAYLFYGGTSPRVTRLITPQIEFGIFTNHARLSFWHYMEAWAGDQDELRVLYRTSPTGAWVVLAAYTSSVASWTERTLTLPNPNNSYTIAFQGTAKWGYGIAVDDVLVTGDPPPLPTVVTEPASDVRTNTATLNGTVNPNGSSTTYWFEYGTNAAYGWATAPGNAGSGNSAVAVSNTVNELQPDTEYHFRIAASNVSGVVYGADRNFRTQALPPPAVETETATGVTAYAATLRGRVNPNGLETTWWFEYGTNTTYDNSTPPASAGAGADPLEVNADVTNLLPETAYHFRAAASNASGATYGEDREFVTKAAPPVLSVPPDSASLDMFVLQWSSSSSRWYSVLYSTNLQEGFLPLATNLPGTPPVNVYTDEIENVPFRYYRIRAEE